MDELLETEAIEMPAAEAEAEELTVRPLPARFDRGREMSVWKGDVRSAAIAAAGGLVAGAATVAVARATRSSTSRKRSPRGLRGRDRTNIVASRSFIVDVHMLGSK